MNKREETKRIVAALVGALLGLAASGYFIVYLPMKANYARGGCVWLECPAPAQKDEAE